MRTLALAPLLLSSCMSMEGVMTVDIALRPVSVAVWPDWVDPAAYAGLPAATGFAHADAMAETGWIDVGPLPMPPDGYVYVAILDVADEPRGALPGGEGTITRITLPLHPMTGPRHGGAGWWTGSFDSGLLGRSVAGLRAARFALDGFGVQCVLLEGSVEAQAAAAPPSAPEGAGTHVH